MEKTASIQRKILTGDMLSKALAVWKLQGKKVVFTNGCFDILHYGHVDYLSKAADMGDILVIGINSDASVRKLKGNTRPINDEFARCMLLASLGFVDAVVVFDEETPYELIRVIQPDVLVKGKDYKAEEIVGYDVVVAKGGLVATIDLVEGYSTSNIERKIQGLATT